MENTVEAMKNYAQYHTQDFLTDLFFMDWIYRNDPEASLFFKELIEKNPHLVPSIEEAVSILRKVKIEQPLPAPQTVEAEWKAFDRAIARKMRNHIVIRRFIGWSAIAASVTILLSIGLFLHQQEQPEIDYLSMLNTTPTETLTDSQIQLYLDRQEILNLSEQEEVIYQNGNVIIAQEEEIVKEQNLDSRQKLNKLVVPYGKRMNLTLGDGSRVWVNSGTTIIYPSQFDQKKREIFINGEAYLEVAHEENREFIVKTTRMEVAVLGTSFNVSAYNEDSECSVALVSGKVAIKNSGYNDITLSPNQLYRLTNDGQCGIESVNARDYICWREGLMKVDSEYLNSIFKRLSRYYNASIVYDKQEDMLLKCNGKLNLTQDIRLVLNTIQTTAPVTIREENNQFIVERIKKEVP